MGGPGQGQQQLSPMQMQHMQVSHKRRVGSYILSQGLFGVTFDPSATRGILPAYLDASWYKL